MRKYLFNFLFVVFILLFVCDRVQAETYRRGIINKSTVIKKDGNGSANMPNDLGGTMTLTAPEAVEITDESSTHYQIKFLYSAFTYYGWVPKGNVDAYTYTIDEGYRQQLINAGFPADYARQLAALHAVHPNWVFTPSFTGGVTGGLDFYTAVNGEAYPVDKNLVGRNVNIKLRSTEDGAYSNGVWKEFSGGGWFAASKQTIAYYMDPRNFLNENHIFMFENQAYNAAIQYKPMVEKALIDTFMSAGKSFVCLSGANGCTLGTHYYIDTFIEVGGQTNVNPVHLAARARKEQGDNGSTLSSGGGYNGEYVGYYNFFNINANGSTTADVLTNGFKHAVLMGWNNPYASIKGGAQVIGNNYISKGQSNGYYQKFNTVNNSQIYYNQYMQNISAPYGEAYNTYVSYFRSFNTLAEWDNNTYEFLIPIYKNMGALTSLDPSYNSDATLQNLSIPECKFNMDFSSSALEYDCYVDKSVSTLNVSASATNAQSKLEYPAKVTLDRDESTVVIKVTAANGASKTYTVLVHRIAKDNASPLEVLNNAGYKVTGEYVSNMEFNSDVSNIISSIRNTSHFADVKVIGLDGSAITSGKVTTGQIVTVTNGQQSVSYRIVIYGDINSDNKIDIVDLLAIQKHILNAKALTDVKAVAADTNKDGKVDLIDLLAIQKYILGDGNINQG